jgi:hypothetical protein
MKMKAILYAIGLYTLFILALPAHAYVGLCCGKCGGNMPLAFPGSGIPETHEWRGKSNQSWMNMLGLIDGTTSKTTAEGLAQGFMMVPNHMSMSMTGLSAGYSPSERIFFMPMIMWMNKDMTMINGSDTTSKMSSSGMADGMLMAKYLLAADDILIPAEQWTLLFGSSVPLGSVTKKGSDGNILPYNMQLGSGTFDPFVGLQYGKNLDPFWVGGTVQYKARMYDNNKGYRLGNEIRYDLYAMQQFSEKLVGEILLEGRHTSNIVGELNEAEAGLGHMSNNPAMGYMSPLWDPSNSGQHLAYLSVGFQVQPTPLWIINMDYGIPIVQTKDGLQMKDDHKIAMTIYFEFPTSKSKRSKKLGAPDVLGF